MERLHTTTLGRLRPGIEQPGYDRARLRAGILHLGLGAFHRAHQAVYTEASLKASAGDWGIVGVCMRGDTVGRQLRPQDLLYSVWSRGATEERVQVIGALIRVILAPEEPEALDAAFADPGIRVVTLTVTEKGYCLADDGWSLDTQLPAVRADLGDPVNAHTAVGLLARGLAKRCESGGAPITVLSCDNLSENGARLAKVVHQYVEAAFPGILPWLEECVSFPCSMVDRIVPAMTAARREAQAQRLDLRDEAAVATEPFSQWIIEDDFAAGVPDWQSAGAQLVDDIRPFEAIKLRLLNAAHSAIAYAGLLAGHETVADVMADMTLCGFVERLMAQELAVALDVPADFDIDAYRGSLLQRFANPHLQHRCAQIAMDGTEKIRQRWLPTLRQLPDESMLLRAMAAWCYFVLCTEHELEDPRRERLLSLRGSDAPLVVRLEELLACLGLTRSGDVCFSRWIEALRCHCELLSREDIHVLLQMDAPRINRITRQ